MLFSSNIFLFTFLPLSLLIYHVIERSFKIRDLSNFAIFAMSAFFYFWGSGKFIFIFFASILLNYYLGEYLYYSERERIKRWVFALGISCNLLLLGYFKYWNFFHDQISLALSSIGLSQLSSIPQIFLPIGISFYTFMAISYLFETRLKQTKAETIIDFAMYMTLFPHLVAGPIVRFSQIDHEARDRSVSLSMFEEGIWRFCFGLFKKVVIANSLGVTVDRIFALPNQELTCGLAWLAALCYAFQIFFDFSGYSDMAIGLARFFGFKFPENFNSPYRAVSITDFWRRWHMTLSLWFRDFLYIPLGGNRGSELRTYMNLVIVFFLCGLWHGASWHFVVWGLFHGSLLIIERLLKNKFGIEGRGFTGRIVTFLLVIIGWIYFRATSLDQAHQFFAAMLGLHSVPADQSFFPIGYYLPAPSQLWLLVGAAISWFPIEKIWDRMPASVSACARPAIALSCFAYGLVLLSKAVFTPFIYFQF